MSKFEDALSKLQKSIKSTISSLEKSVPDDEGIEIATTVSKKKPKNTSKENQYPLATETTFDAPANEDPLVEVLEDEGDPDADDTPLVSHWQVEDSSRVFTAERPEWPVTKITLANSGPFGPVLKEYLDSMEPLISLIADEVGTTKEKYQQARNVVMACGYLTIVQVIAQAAYVLHHGWDFQDGNAQRQLRVSWIDDGPNAAYEHIGWGYNDDFVNLVRTNTFFYETLGNLLSLINQINTKYPEVPDWEIRQHAEKKLVIGVCELINLSPTQMLKHLNIDAFEYLPSWDVFSETFQETDFEHWSDAYPAFLENLGEFWDENQDVNARLYLLRSFASSFQAPYTLRDMSDWAKFAEDTYEFLIEHDMTAKLMDSLYEKPYDPEYGTEVPNQDVFLELNKVLTKNLTPVFETAEIADDFFAQLASFELIVAAREHFLSASQVKTLNKRWDKYFDLVKSQHDEEQADTKSLESGSFMIEISELIGLTAVKKRLNDLAVIKRSESSSIELPVPKHMVFAGNPGTGKTTVAQLLGKIYKTMGLLPKGHVVSVTRQDLVAEYTGQTAPKVAKAIGKAMGGILFIDEAYTLHRSGVGESDNFGQEAIDALLTHMENDRGKFLVIVAGYPAEMHKFVTSNPGVESRFAETWQFDDYSEQELFQIFVQQAQSRGIDLVPEIEQQFISIARDAKKKSNFSNARWVRNVFEETFVRYARRVTDEQEAKQLSVKDLKPAEEVRVISKENKVEIEARLQQLVGLETVKDDIRDLMAMQSLRIRRQAQGLPVAETPLSHLVFSGPPGTGKTTVARLIGQIYKEIGLLESGHIVETQRADLVAGFVGQTALKTEAAVMKAMGGVLFIDEAYTLIAGSRSDSSDFGQEAIDTILKYMEDKKGEFLLIVAGYEKEMEEFLKSNPGLQSRFGKTLQFSAWTSEQVFRDVTNRLDAEKIKLEAEAEESLETLISKVQSSQNFASGRSARTIFEKIIEAQARRLAAADDGDLTLVSVEDIENAQVKLQSAQ